jgi:hypothetical protein
MWSRDWTKQRSGVLYNRERAYGLNTNQMINNLLRSDDDKKRLTFVL